MIKWFGKGCGYQCCRWEENEETGGPDYKEARPALVFCNHKQNKNDFEGNCNERLCPLETPDNSTGIGGDCANCGRENIPVYSYTTKDETQTVDVCENCLKVLP